MVSKRLEKPSDRVDRRIGALMKVLYQDNHLLVVNKPPTLPTMGGETGVESVHSWAADYLKRKFNKPGNVFVGIVSRLDQVTSGVLVLARTSKAASRLTIQFGGPGKNKKVTSRARKLYLAMVEGDPVVDSHFSPTGSLTDQVWKDDPAHRMRVARKNRDDAKEARLNYAIIQRNATHSLIAVELQSGRKHQIRLQFADRGHPILGDQKYGSQSRFPSGISLHSWQLLLTHPTSTEPFRFVAAPPPCWNQVFADLPAPAAIESQVSESLQWPSDPPATPGDII